MFFLRISFCIVLASYCSSVGLAQKKEGPGLSAVGMATRGFVDETRKNWQGTGPRPLNIVIWYPAAEGSPMKPFVATAEDGKFYGDPALGKLFTEIPVAFGAPLLMNGQKHPLILLSHGSTSLGLALMWLGYYLASHGYIVAAVNHHGNTAAEGQFLPQGFSLVWERPKTSLRLLRNC